MQRFQNGKEFLGHHTSENRPVSGVEGGPGHEPARIPEEGEPMSLFITTEQPAVRLWFGRRAGLAPISHRPSAVEAEMPCAKRWLAAALLSVLVPVGGLFAPPLQAREYSMFDKISGAELVIVGRVLKAKTKAEIEVEQVLKGEWSGDTLEIRFRGANYERRKIGIEKIQFYEGERLVLYLRSRSEKARGKGRFVLYPEDNRGRLELHDDEEARLILGAINTCVEARFENREELRDVWRQMAREHNVFLRLCGLESLEYDRALDMDALPLLAALYNDRYPVIRQRALQLTAVVARYRPTGFQGTPQRQILMDEVIPLLGDEQEIVRLEAVRTMKYLGDREILPRLREIGRTDPSQEVRLEATRVVFQEEAGWLAKGESAVIGDDSGEESQ